MRFGALRNVQFVLPEQAAELCRPNSRGRLSPHEASANLTVPVIVGASAYVLITV
jgi:hypothetical protein